MLVIKDDDLSLVPRSHIVEREAISTSCAPYPVPSPSLCFCIQMDNKRVFNFLQSGLGSGSVSGGLAQHAWAPS